MASGNTHLRHDEEDMIPERTTPQGTQEYGAENVHEETDVSVRGIIIWLAGLGISTVVVCVVLAIAFPYLVHQPEKDVVPSPLFAVEQAPPQPRVLPSPVEQRRRPGQPLMGPWEYREEIEEIENEELAELGLIDPATGLAKLPDEPSTPAPAAGAGHEGAGGEAGGAHPGGPPAGGHAGLPRSVRTEPRPDTGLQLPVYAPSDSSGGLRMENRQR